MYCFKSHKFSPAGPLGAYFHTIFNISILFFSQKSSFWDQLFWKIQNSQLCPNSRAAPKILGFKIRRPKKTLTNASLRDSKNVFMIEMGKRMALKLFSSASVSMAFVFWVSWASVWMHHQEAASLGFLEVSSFLAWRLTASSFSLSEPRLDLILCRIVS